ncbi:MAG: metallophosphoesterase family protein [Tuberibacillus sp.]
MSITFIHAADIHLDRPFLGLNSCSEAMRKRVRESTYTAFSRLVNIAIARKVDFVLLVGDIFDASHRGLTAETRFKGFMKQLAAYGIEVYMIHGNHDPIDGHWSGLTYGENVHVFGPRPECFRYQKPDGTSVNIYGFSYPSQHVHEDMVDLYQKEPGSDYHVAMLHGSIKGNTDHDVYAPFNINDLLNKEMDYWALGHIHKGDVLSSDPPVIYSGSLQGLSIKETGEKGFRLVTLDGKNVRTEFIKASDIIWQDMELDVSGAESFDWLVKAAEERKEQAREFSAGVILRMTLTGEWSLNQEMTDHLMEALRTGEDERPDFVWVLEIKDDTIPLIDRDKLKNSPHFIGSVIRLFDQKPSVQDDLQPLYGHAQAKKYLTSLSEEDRQSLIKNAEKLILKGLYHSGLKK